ncbi:AmpG protein, beta-lactamase induction signal transducer [Minicystis rosea]|nr:AmpG protein, beta-lactamase induction signal transducer [Minicystis rosea]
MTPNENTITAPRPRHPITWVPTAYVAEGIPFAMVTWAIGTMFKDLGHSDSKVTLSTATIGIAWSLKPLWASFLDMYRTKRFFVLAMELFMALVLAGVALCLPLPNHFQIIIAALWVFAFASATQDICVDGVYITTLDKKQQAAWIGVQGMCWNVGRIFATAAVVWFAGSLKDRGFDTKMAWMYALGLAAATMGVLSVYHFFVLPTGSLTRRPESAREVVDTFSDAVTAFFKKESIWGMLLFVFLYRIGEGFLLVEAPLFLQAPLSAGGLGLTLSQKAIIDGTVSTTVSIVGGLLGGAFVSRLGLKRSLLILAFCMNVPHLCYVYLSHAVSPTAPLSLHTIYLLVSIEKFGYSFGFVGNMLYMMQQIAPGKHKMTHYAFATALMNLVLVPTQSVSGPLADWLGYKRFFIFVLVASLPSLFVAWRAPFPNREGEVEEEAEPAEGQLSSGGAG